MNLGDLYMNQFSSHTHPKVAALFHQAKELQRELARQHGVPFYENLPEHIPPLVKGNLLEYERLHSEWIEGKRSATPKEIAVKYGILGVISQKKGDLDKAEERFLKSLQLLESLPEPEALLESDIANQYVNLGINSALRMRREYAKAEEYWVQARDRYRHLDAKIAHTIDQWIQGIRSESSTK